MNQSDDRTDSSGPSTAADERGAIVRSAWTVLERSGFEGFKVQLVMREADVSARSFYRHFSDKEELLLALLRDEMARAALRLRAAVAKAEGPVERVEVWIRSVIDAAVDPRRVARARLFSSQQPVMRRFPTEVDEGAHLLMEPLRDAIADGASAGIFPLADPDRDPEMIYRLTGGAMTNALAERADLDLDEVVGSTTHFVLRALGFSPAPPRGG
jgi:TetR/AcrR family transcriptional regulator